MSGASTDEAGATQTNRSRRGPRRLAIAFAVLFALVCISGVVAFLGFSGRPGHWTEQQARIESLSPTEREAVSEALMNRLLTQWSESRGEITTPDDLIGQRTDLVIPYDQLNIWLAEEGIDLLASVGIQLPRSVRGVMVDSPGDGRLRVSCDVQTRRFDQVVALVFDIRVDDDGTVTSELTQASTGRLPLPTAKAIDMIAKRSASRSDSSQNADTANRLLHLMNGTPTGPIDVPIDPTRDGLRDGRLVGLDIRNDALVVTRETVRRSRSESTLDSQ